MTFVVLVGSKSQVLPALKGRGLYRGLDTERQGSDGYAEVHPSQAATIYFTENQGLDESE